MFKLPVRTLLPCALALLALHATARCVDETSADAGMAADAPAASRDPRKALGELVQDALSRSQAVGAARLLSEAALSDIDEARAAQGVQASVGAGFGPGGSRSNGVADNSAAQLRATVSASQLLWDGGRTRRLIDWRSELAESARHGLLSQREQLALSAVALALERSRWRMTVQVYGGYVRKMGCLVEALETIVRTDRGRASELVQARKSLQQAELAQTQAQSSGRQADVRLRRLVGDGLPVSEGLSTVFSGLPELARLVAEAEQSSDIAALDAQAQAASRYADAVAAGSKPQVSWSIGGAANAGHSSNQGSARSSSYSLGLTVAIPLLSPSTAPATDAARKRAQAAALQRADAAEARRFRVADLYEQMRSGQDRARRLVEVLRDSEQVRSFTLQQWQQLGKRSLFDVMATESEHYNLRVSYVNALHDVQQLNANLLSLGRGVIAWLQ